jgi:hypothetical protein
MRPDLDVRPRQVVKRAALRENLLRNEKRGRLGALAAVWQRTLPLKEQMDRIRSDVEAAYVAKVGDGAAEGSVEALRRAVEAAAAAEAEAEAAVGRARAAYESEKVIKTRRSAAREAAEQALAQAVEAETELHAQTKGKIIGHAPLPHSLDGRKPSFMGPKTAECSNPRDTTFEGRAKG